MKVRQEFDENALSTFLINDISEIYRVKAYMYTQRREANNGSDMLWLVATNSGVYKFLIQAKKIKGQIARKQALYRNGKQINNLLSTASKSQSIPLYILYSKDISKIKCGQRVTNNIKEGIFFDSAKRIYKHFFNDENVELKHRPLTCLFSMFSHRCPISDLKACEACEACDACAVCEEEGEYFNHCLSPFFQLSYLYEINDKPQQLNDAGLLLLYAESLTRKDRQIQLTLLDKVIESRDEAFNTINSVVIIDYMNRHDKNYMSALMGDDFQIDEDSILSKEKIIDTIIEAWKKYPYFFNIGLFGSYSREGLSCMDYSGKSKPPNEHSDIDIALVYDQGRIRTDKHLNGIVEFLKYIPRVLQKNVDFVDFQACTDKDFLKSIEKQMIWLKDYK